MRRKSESRIAFLRPGEIADRLAEMPVVYIPIGPLEWHGPHLPFGTDPLNAENVALGVCVRTGGVVWPTQFWGTEKERRPEQLRSLGFSPDEYIVGMDFPKNTLKSMYCPEEVLAILVREMLRETTVLGAKLAVIINGHGAENQIDLLKRLETEFNNTTDLKVYFRIAAPREIVERGSGEHAAAMETSAIMHAFGDCVDLAELPPIPERMRYTDYAVVDGPGFDGGGAADGCLAPANDPRTSASAEVGRALVEKAVSEIVAEITDLTGTLGLVRRRK